MKPPNGNKMMMMIIIAVTIFWGNPFLSYSFQEEPGRSHEAPALVKHLLFLAESNLYDGRWLLEKKDKIGLTGEQQEKIEDLMLVHEAFSIRNSGEIKIKELRFAAYLKTGNMDRKQMEQHIREISREKTALIVNYANYLLDVRNILTPQQLKTLEHLKEQKRTEARKKKREPK
jgi:Spy/CpxP family protein refolding chaperone